MTAPLVTLLAAAREAWPWLPAVARVASILIGPSGETLRVGPGGELDPIIRGGLPWSRSIASDPCAGRGA